MEEQPTSTSDQHEAFTEDQQAYVAAYLSTVEAKGFDFDRLVTEPSGLTHEEMHNIFAHPDLSGRALEVMVDIIKPEGSMYFDAIFGPNYGQRDVRHWLLPTMMENAFLQFRPTGPSIFMDDGEGGTSLDEWVMVAAMEDEEVFLGNGISVRRFRDGWMVDAIDVYDSAISRTPPPPEMIDPNAPPPPELPPYPVMNFKAVAEEQREPISDAARAWMLKRQASHAAGSDPANTQPSGLTNDELHHLYSDPVAGMDFNLVADMMHPTDSVYIDPIFGRFEGQDAIRAWYTDIMGKVGDIRFEPLSKTIWNGETSLHMFRQYAEPVAGEKIEMVWGFSVRKYRDGWIVYAADYFDTASMANPAMQSVGEAIGSSITLEDIMKYRAPG